MKKRIVCLLFAALMGMLAVLPAFAAAAPAAPAAGTVVRVETYADGSYDVITIADAGAAVRGTVSKTKSSNHYDSSGALLWTVSLTATFTYTGSSATCTSATPGHTIYNSNWKVTSESASRSGNTATGNFTVKRYALIIPVETINRTLTLTCSNSGVVS